VLRPISLMTITGYVSIDINSGLFQSDDSKAFVTVDCIFDLSVRVSVRC